MRELVSVIVPVYNVELYLKFCVESIIMQTYENLEIILVDDGSQDGSDKICDDYANNDPRIKVVHKTNGGVSDARNWGVKAATGKYIAFVDSDDYIHEDMYSILYQTLVRYDADIVQCGHYIISDNTITDMIHSDGNITVHNQKEAIREIMFDETINSFAWDKLYKRELFEDFKYKNLNYHEDIASTFKLFLKSTKVVCNNIPLYYYVRNQESISHTLSPEKYYSSYKAFKERESTIKEFCPEALEKNTIYKCTMGISALNTMIRKGDAKYKKNIQILMREMEQDKNIIKKASYVPQNVKLYFSLLSHPGLYRRICLLNLHRKR